MKVVCSSCGKAKQGFTRVPVSSVQVGNTVMQPKQASVILCNECLWKLYHQALVEVMSMPAFALRHATGELQGTDEVERFLSIKEE